MFSLQSDIEVIAEASNGEEAIKLSATHQPDVVLMDVRMPVLDGVAATQTIKQNQPAVQVIILTTFDEDEYVFEGLRAGAIGYLLKDTSSQKLCEAVRAAARGESLLQPSVAAKLVAEFSRISTAESHQATANAQLAEPLTERELQVLAHLSQGKSNKQIATALFLTEGTIKNYVSQILAKLGVPDRTQAALRARELKLV
jgi:DNA-binding NarL/FixJ family response regulator